MRTNSLLGNFEELDASFNPIKDIEQFIRNNYNISNGFRISKEPNKNGKYEVDVSGVVRVICLNIHALTNNLFEWRNVGGNFSCSYCKKLTSLKGAPEKVGKNFNYSNCDSLETLEGCPEEVGGSFNCFDCKSLILTADIPNKNIREKIIRYYSCNYSCNVLF